MANEKKYASLSSLQTFLENIKSKFATKATVDELSSEVAYINSTDNETITDVVIPEGGGSSIDVTAEVGQTIVVEEVDDNGKPTKWKAAEYQPRTHWTENATILPETTCEVIEDIGAAMLPDMAISAGDTLTVVFNGTEYTCECADVDGSLAFGNYGVMDEENPVDTGEPFLAMNVWADESTKVWIAMALDGSATFTLSVIGEAHHKIPNQYINNEYLRSLVLKDIETAQIATVKKKIVNLSLVIQNPIDVGTERTIRDDGWLWKETANYDIVNFIEIPIRYLDDDYQVGLCAVRNSLSSNGSVTSQYVGSVRISQTLLTVIIYIFSNGFAIEIIEQQFS